MASLVLLAACHRGGVPAVATRACLDSMESRAIECSGGAARRSGDTLFIRLDNGRDTTFVDTQGELPFGFHYAGRVGHASLHVIEEYGREAPPSWIMLDGRSGRSILAYDKPTFSPDSTRFATASEDWNNCTELDHPRMDVWRMTDSLPVLEWRLDPWSCRTVSGWGPTAPIWTGGDTLRFTRNDAKNSGGETTSRPVFAVREGEAWRVVDSR